MYEKQHTRQETVRELLTSFEAGFDLAKFGPKEEEKFYAKPAEKLTRSECVKNIKASLAHDSDIVSNLASIHPAWIVSALADESPKIIGIILRWLPSRHVNYILEHLPKRVKLALPKLVESFAVPTEILKLIKANFEKKFEIAKKRVENFSSLEDVSALMPEALEVFFRDIGLNELAMAFHDSEPSGIRVLLNKMAVDTARSMQQRMKDVSNHDAHVLKDAKYTILEMPNEQEDIEKLLLDVGMASFSKAMEKEGLFHDIQMKLEPKLSYILKRYIEEHVGANRLAKERQKIILERLNLLLKAGEIVL